MKKMKPLLFYLLNKNKFSSGQVLLLLTSFILIFFLLLVIILGNITYPSLQFSQTFRNFVNLQSLSISGLRYALYQINQDPNFATTSAAFNMPQGIFTYSVSSVNTNTKKIRIEARLYNTNFKKILNATATIDSSGAIIGAEVGEE